MADRLDKARQKARDEALRIATALLRGHAAVTQLYNSERPSTKVDLACLDLADELEERAKPCPRCLPSTENG